MHQGKRIPSAGIRLIAILIVGLIISSGMKISAQTNLSWVKAGYGGIPRNAVVGGTDADGSTLYVCRTTHIQTLLPGKIVGGKCNYNWGTIEYSSANFEVLVGATYNWSGYGVDYSRAIIGGKGGNENYYVCRALLPNGSKQPGRLQNNKCNYGYGGKGYAADSFEILQSEAAAFSLLDAALNGDAPAVREALRNGQAVNQKNQTGQTALMLAASKGSVDVTRILLNEGATIDVRDNEGNTALIYAASKGFPQVFKMLLREGANLNVHNNKDDSAFTLAANGGQIETVRLIINDEAFRGADNPDGGRALILAAANGYTEILRLLLEADADIDSRNENGQTALMRSAANNHADSVRFLLNEGANNKLYDNNRYSAFTTAAFYNAVNAMRVLMTEGGIKSESTEAESALRLAARQGKADSLRFLIQADVDFENDGGENGNTPLMWAATEGQQETTDILINARADLNKQNSRGETALMLAAANSKRNTLRLLIRAGADLNLTDRSGKTALRHAIENGHKDTRKELEKAGAN